MLMSLRRWWTKNERTQFTTDVTSSSTAAAVAAAYQRQWRHHIMPSSHHWQDKTRLSRLGGGVNKASVLCMAIYINPDWSFYNSHSKLLGLHTPNEASLGLSLSRGRPSLFHICGLSRIRDRPTMVIIGIFTLIMVYTSWIQLFIYHSTYYTVYHKKEPLIFDCNSRISWSIFIIFAPV